MEDKKSVLSKRVRNLPDTSINFVYGTEDGVVKVSIDPSTGFTEFRKYPFSGQKKQNYRYEQE